MLKFSSFKTLAAVYVPPNASPQRIARLRRQAHRHHFDYEPRRGYVYVRSRAISSRTNDNFDEFPADEIEKSYRTFVGKPVFVNHVNHDHRRMRGVVIDAALHKDTLADGSPDTWAEVLMEVDAQRFPKLAEALVKGKIDRTSMGCDVAYSICSMCGNKASTPAEYCQHIPRLKGKKVLKRNAATGSQEEHLIRETCYGLSFFENSLLVEEPADPTAYFLGDVDTRGLGKAASRQASFGSSKHCTEDPQRPGWCSFHHMTHDQAQQGRSCHCGGTDHTEAEHSEWAQRKYEEGTHDAWGRPLHQPYDGHGAWNCNNYNCVEHPQEMYQQQPGQAPGWMLHEHDPDKETKREIGRELHGMEPDAGWLLDQQHEGPSKYSALSFFKQAVEREWNDHNSPESPKNHPHVGDDPASCGRCGYDDFDHPHLYQTHKGLLMGCEVCKRMNGKGRDEYHHLHDPGRYEILQRNQGGRPDYRAPKSWFGSDPIPDDLQQQMSDLGDADWLLDQNREGPSKYSLLQHFAQDDDDSYGTPEQRECAKKGHGEWNAHGQCKSCGYTMPDEGDEECDDSYCQEHGFPEGWHTKAEHIDPPHRDPGHEDYQSAERNIRESFDEDLGGWIFPGDGDGPSKYSAKVECDLCGGPHDSLRHYDSERDNGYVENESVLNGIPMDDGPDTDEEHYQDFFGGRDEQGRYEYRHPKNSSLTGMFAQASQEDPDAPPDNVDHDVEFHKAMTDLFHLLAEGNPGLQKHLADPENMHRLIGNMDEATEHMRHAPGTFERHVDDQMRHQGAQDEDRPYEQVDPPYEVQGQFSNGYEGHRKRIEHLWRHHGWGLDDIQRLMDHHQKQFGADPGKEDTLMGNISDLRRSFEQIDIVKQLHQQEHGGDLKGDNGSGHDHSHPDDPFRVETRDPDWYGYEGDPHSHRNDRSPALFDKTYDREPLHPTQPSSYHHRHREQSHVQDWLHPERTDERPNKMADPYYHHETEQWIDPKENLRINPEDVHRLENCPHTYPHEHEARTYPDEGERSQCKNCGQEIALHATTKPSQVGQPTRGFYEDRGRRVLDKGTGPFWPVQHSLSSLFAHEAARPRWHLGPGENEGWTQCDQGHRHWGYEGAAGLLLRHTDDKGETRYLLQHRAPWVDHGDTYGIPGGALDPGETPEQGARREAHEEIGHLPKNLTHVRTHSDDHGGWAYHTVIMDSPTRFQATDTDESGEHGTDWHTAEEISRLPLHPGFAKTWQQVRKASLSPTALFRTAAATDNCQICNKEIVQINPDQPGQGGWQHSAEGGAGVPHQPIPGGPSDDSSDSDDSQQGKGSSGGGEAGGGCPGGVCSVASHHHAAHDDEEDIHSTPENPCESCGSTGTHFHVQIPEETREFFRQMHEHGQQRAEMYEHADKRVVNTKDHIDLKQHMIESHGYEEDEMWRNSFDENHPALAQAGDLDRRLTKGEWHRLHKWEHGHEIDNDDPDYDGGMPGVFHDDSHFHTAVRRQAKLPQGLCGWCYEPISQVEQGGFAVNVHDATGKREGHDGHRARMLDDAGDSPDYSQQDPFRSWALRHAARQRRGQSNVWPVRVKIKDRATGKYTGTHVGQKPKEPYDPSKHQVDQSAWPFRLCSDHLKQLQGDIARHNVEATDHPYTYEPEHDTWPLDPTHETDPGHCHGCIVGSVNKAMAKQAATPYGYSGPPQDLPPKFEVGDAVWMSRENYSGYVTRVHRARPSYHPDSQGVGKMSGEPYIKPEHHSYTVAWGPAGWEDDQPDWRPGGDVVDRSQYARVSQHRLHHHPWMANESQRARIAEQDEENTRGRQAQEDSEAEQMAQNRRRSIRPVSSWMGDYPEEPTLFWRAPKTKRWEVHVENHMPSRDFREDYGSKPRQQVILYHQDNIAPPHPHAKPGSAPRGGWRVERNSNTGEMRYAPTAWGNVIGHVPPHVQAQVDRAQAEVDRHAANHADLYGQMAEQQDIRDDLARVPRDMEAEEKGHRMFRNLLNAAGERTCPHCDGDGNTERGPNSCGMCDGHGFLKESAKKKDDGPTHSGMALKAADTGRVLMIQRSNKDDKDPAAGTWEFPGGGHEDGDQTSLHAAIREWEEEVGQPFPVGGNVSHTWRSSNGVYQGHVVVIPSEDAVDFSDGRATVNPDDPDGDDHEQSAWWDPKHAEKNPALRPECKKSPWDEIRKAKYGKEARFVDPRDFQFTSDSLGNVGAMRHDAGMPEGPGVNGTVYLLHFSEPFGHARHYMGWAANLEGRLAHHERGTGANLLKHVRNAGITWELARTWDGDRNLERRLKIQGGHSRKCPVCKGGTEDDTVHEAGLATQASEGDYRGSHEAPDADDGSSMHDPSGIMPDVHEHPEYYCSPYYTGSYESHSALMSVKDKPEKSVMVYRAVPHGVKHINPGDWVTPSRDYAREHAQGGCEGCGKSMQILKAKVKAKHLHGSGDITEWGYTGEQPVQTWGSYRMTCPKQASGDEDKPEWQRHIDEGLDEIGQSEGFESWDHMQRHQRDVGAMQDLMHRYEGGAQHPLHPGKFDADDHEHDGDKAGQPYYEVEDPAGSGWTARDYGGANVHIYHRATPDQAHDLIEPEGSDPGHIFQTGQKPLNYGHDELHQTLNHWVHGNPNPDPRYTDDIDPETGREYSYAKDHADADPRIKRWQRRKGYTAARSAL